MSLGLRPRPLFCGRKLLWKSVDVSSAFDSVYDMRNCELCEGRLPTARVIPLYQLSPNDEYCRIDADEPGMPPLMQVAAGFAEHGRSFGRRLVPRTAGSAGL